MDSLNESNIEELKVLASYLEENQDDILKEWEKHFYENEQASKLITLSRQKFRNHIPKFLDVLNKRLRKKGDSPKEIAIEHGINRWEHGLDLREMSTEWTSLHEILIKNIGAATQTFSITSDTLSEAQLIITRVINEGINNSIDEFYQLQVREAQAQMNDVESALSKKISQGENIQQTSHDLKGILFSLKMGITMLEKRDLDEDTREVIKDMSLAAESMEQFLNNLLDLFRLEAGKAEVEVSSFDVETVITRICKSLRPVADSKGLNLRCQGTEPLQVQGDRKKLQRIVQNILINALKYTKEGKVEVSWKRKSEQDWQLTISDTGPGLSSTKAASLTTESNNQEDASEESHGEGIGLLIVRRLCKLLNGVIDIDTSPDSGTTFRIILPLAYGGE